MATMKLPHASKGGEKSRSYKNRFSLAASLAMCYSDEEYPFFANGTSPSSVTWDRETDGILREMVKGCVPESRMLYPRDGMTRAEQAAFIPDHIKALLTSCTFGENGARCGTCDKCIEDKSWS